MTDQQFTALAQLLRMRSGKAQEAARIVLVDGKRQRDAAATTGLTEVGVSKVMRRCRRGLALVQAASK